MNIISEKDISIIIPLYKGQKFCAHLFEMIDENCRYKDLYKTCEIEVILVNDYPEEKITIEREERHFSIKLINQKKNEGIQASRIKGILSSKGKYIIMLDQDDLVKERWLYSQWNKIGLGDSHFCVCNGWKGRFRTIWSEENIEKKVNNLNYYLTFGNAICSPGQVIIEKKYLPKEWLENIQICNGADDFFLWIIILKKGECFSVNNEYLYYHTPDRNKDSISDAGMISSLKETFKLLNLIGIMESKELLLLRKQIEQKERINSDSNRDIRTYLKFEKMFQIMLKWMKIRNEGLGINYFCKDYNYRNIAIYGMGYIGECLYEELTHSDIIVKYAIDCAAKDFKQELSIFRVEEKLEPVDIVIVTVVEDTEEIIKKVREKMKCSIITIEEVLFRLEKLTK